MYFSFETLKYKQKNKQVSESSHQQESKQSLPPFFLQMNYNVTTTLHHKNTWNNAEYNKLENYDPVNSTYWYSH